MAEEVLFKSEGPKSREEIASYLRAVADSFEEAGPIILSAGEQSVELDPPAHATFEVKAEREGPVDSPGELSVEFEVEWDEDADDSELQIG